MHVRRRLDVSCKFLEVFPERHNECIWFCTGQWGSQMASWNWKLAAFLCSTPAIPFIFSTTCSTDGSLPHPCSDQTRKGCLILENAVCLALKGLWLYRRWSSPCCYPSLTLCYMVWACEHPGNPAELCDSGDVPALRTHPLPAAGKTIKHTHVYTHANSLIMYALSCSHYYKLIMFNFKTLLSRVRKSFCFNFCSA